MSCLGDIFERVTFDEEDRQLHSELYSDVKGIAKKMDEKAKDCAEKTLAFRALHLALMHFGAALSKADKYKS